MICAVCEAPTPYMYSTVAVPLCLEHSKGLRRTHEYDKDGNAWSLCEGGRVIWKRLYDPGNDEPVLDNIPFPV